VAALELDAEHRVLEWLLHDSDDFDSFFFCQNG
jgi:hypothetical protein